MFCSNMQCVAIVAAMVLVAMVMVGVVASWGSSSGNSTISVVSNHSSGSSISRSIIEI